MRLYGAYGSNLNTEQMRKRCPNSIPLCSIYLEDWSLVFKGVADLEKNRGSIVLLGIYEITKECEKSLDLYYSNAVGVQDIGQLLKDKEYRLGIKLNFLL